jgi:cytochrome c biogenesis protein CcmG, thiol:disulfide interchange protein DsbE
MYRTYRDSGLRVLAISIDDAGQLPTVREFVREHGLTFEILHDHNAEMMQQYRMLGVPQTFLITRGGEIFATRFVADWDSPASRALVDSLLAIQ